MTTNIPPEIAKALQKLKAHGFEAHFAASAAEARAIILGLISAKAAVGIGDSVSLRQTGAVEDLIKRGNPVINPFTEELTGSPASRKTFVDLCRKTLAADVFLTGANAVTEDGQIMSVDYAGNRVAGMIFGAPQVILVIGRNKITRDIEQARNRIRNVIAPFHAINKGRKTPCTVTGECADCESPGRLCGVTVILERKLAHFSYSIILVNEDLGLGWDPKWPSERIDSIKAAYLQNSWSFALETRKK
jgi:L-lactate utilization protein LutB